MELMDPVRNFCQNICREVTSMVMVLLPTLSVSGTLFRVLYHFYTFGPWLHFETECSADVLMTTAMEGTICPYNHN